MAGTLSLLIALFGLVVACLAVDWDTPTPLDLYVHRDDPFYSWEVLDSHEGEGFTLHVLNLTSQRWQDETVSNRPMWHHFLSVIIPDEIRVFDSIILQNQIGLNGDSAPSLNTTMIQRLGKLAVRSGAVMAQVTSNPNQPVVFQGTILPRLEDQMIAYTWKLFIEDLEEPDPEIVLLLPMTKVAKQAVDAVAEFTSTINPALDIQHYLPTGVSKRGWVSWLLACTDQRVIATAPVVFDHLNFLENLQHHMMSFGAWSFAFLPYWSEGVHLYLNHPRAEEIAEIIDPLAYNERLTLPKLMLIASGDEFLRLDASHLFWDDLNGDSNYMLILEGAGHIHSQFQDRVYDDIEAFFSSLVSGYQLPELSWERFQTSEAGTIIARVSDTPTVIRGWWADTTNHTGDRRDFRQATLQGSNPIEWNSEPVEDLQPQQGPHDLVLVNHLADMEKGDGEYRFEVPVRSDEGWRAFFIQVVFEGPEGRELDFSTEVEIIPDTFPFERCTTPEECDKGLV